MKNKIKKLTDSEFQVLNLLWDSEEPLTSSEIVHLCKNRTWKPSYIHIMINSLLSKEMIVIAGFKKTTKNYARTFAAAMSREDWALLQVTQQQASTSKTLSNLFTALVEEETDEEVLDILSDILNARKQKLKENHDSSSDSSK